MVNTSSRVLYSALTCLIAAASASAEQVFESQPVWSSGTTVSGGDGIARFIDFDRDGDLDFVTAAPEPKRWVLYRNDDGRIGSRPVWASNETSDLDHIDVLDFDGDGWLDLAATHETYCSLYLNRKGHFNAAPDWETGLIANANQIDFADYDGDGDLDMLMAGGDPIKGVALFETTGDFPSPIPTQKLGHEEYSEAAIFADYYANGDAKLDVVAHYPSGMTVVYRNLGDRFDSPNVVFVDRGNPWTQRHYLFDLDGDGVTELFAAKGPWGNNGMSLQLARDESYPLLTSRWQSAADTMIHAFEFGDVDGDGDDDLVASDYAKGGLVYVYLATNGQLAESPAQTLTVSGPAHEAVLGDVDGDGDLDLAVGGRDQAHIFLNETH